MSQAGALREGVLSCSFCLKSQDSVARLFSSPSDYQRTYICDECVYVCMAVLEEERGLSEARTEVVTAGEEMHPLLTHPLASSLFTVIERWIRCESLGGDAARDLAEVRRIAAQIVAV